MSDDRTHGSPSLVYIQRDKKDNSTIQIRTHNFSQSLKNPTVLYKWYFFFLKLDVADLSRFIRIYKQKLILTLVI